MIHIAGNKNMNTNTKHTPESAAAFLGFQNVELMLAHFKTQVMNGGIYEALKRRQNQIDVRNDLIAFGEAEGRRLALKEGRAL